MAKRGALYRCALFSFLFGGDPQTEGTESHWTQDLAPVGDRTLLSGEMVELFVTIHDSPVAITADTPIRFDILEHDVIVDDRVGSILSGEAAPSGEPFPVLGYRETRAWTLPLHQTAEEAVAQFVAAHPADYADYLLVLRDPALAETYHLLAWWQETHSQEAGDAEFYFIVNVGAEFDDTADPVLNVKPQASDRPPGEPPRLLLSTPLLATALAAPFPGEKDVDEPNGDEVPVEDDPQGPLDERGADDAPFRVEVQRLYQAFLAQAQAGQPTAAAGAGTEAVEPVVGTGGKPAPTPTGKGAPAAPAPKPASTWPYVHPEDWVLKQNLQDDASRDRIVDGASPFEGRVISYLDPDFDVEVRSTVRRYVESYDFARALSWGQKMFGPGGYVMLEGPIYFPTDSIPDGKEPRYLILPTEKRFDEKVVVHSVQAQDPDSETLVTHIFVRYPTFPYYADPKLGTFVFRLFSRDDGGGGAAASRDSGYTRADAPFYPEMKSQLLVAALMLQGFSEDTVAQQFAARAFAAVDTEIAAKNDSRAVELLGTLARDGFAQLDAKKRHDYFMFLVGQLGILFRDDEVNHALAEIMAAVKDATELDEIRNGLTDTQVARLTRGLDSELWDMLEEIGRRFGDKKPLSIDADFVFTIVKEALGAKDASFFIRLAVSVLVSPGALFLGGSELMGELAQAARGLIDFLKDFVTGLANLVAHPGQLIQGIASLVELMAKAVFAAIPLPKTISLDGLVDAYLPFLQQQVPGAFTRQIVIDMIRKEAPPELLNRLDHPTELDKLMLQTALDVQDQARKELSALGKHIEDTFTYTYRGAERFRVTEDVLRRIRWRAVWEIASLFVGVGEVKAVVSGTRGLVLAGVALVSRLRTGEAGLQKILSFASILSREARIADAAGFTRALSHLPAEDLHAAEDALGKVQRLDDVHTMEQLAQHNPGSTAVQDLSDIQDEAHAMANLQKKLGGTVSQAAEDVFAALRNEAKLTRAQLQELMSLLPGDQAEAFTRAVANLKKDSLGGLREFPYAFYHGLAGSPNSIALLENGDVAAFSRLRNFTAVAAGGAEDWAQTERLVGAYQAEAERLRNAGDLAGLNKLVEEVQAGNPERLRGLAGQPPPPPTLPTALTPRRRLPVVQDVPPGLAQVKDLFGGSGDIYFKLGDTAEETQRLRKAVEVMADRNPSDLRRLVVELDEATYADRKASLLKRLRDVKKTEGYAGDAEKALDKLHAAFRDRVATEVAGVTRAAINDQLTAAGFQSAVEGKLAEMRQRLADFQQKAAAALGAAEKASAEASARSLQKEIDALTAWSQDPARQAELAQLQDAVENSLLLKDRLRNGGGPMVQRLAVDMLFKPGTEAEAVKTIPKDFVGYLVKRMGEFRGYAGEMDLAFRLGPEYLVMKAPDAFVTRTGTDLIALRWKDGAVLVFDNKAVRELKIREVSALLENLAKNLGDDAERFAALSREMADAPPQFGLTAQRLESAAEQIQQVLDTSRKVTSRRAQARIAKILQEHKIQLLVANEGGQVKGISKTLRKTLDFWDSRSAVPVPARPPAVKVPVPTP